MNLTISIITVSFNSAHTINDSIKSVLGQSYQNIEYIIIDGMSTDGTQSAVKAYGNKIDKFISEPDNGIYDAMNKGIAIASGDVVGILNSDDIYYTKNTISNVMDRFNNNYVDSVHGDLVYVNEEDLFDVTRYWKSSAFFKNSFKKGWHPPHPSFFVRREIYEKYGYFDTKMEVSADFDIMLRFLERYNISSSYLPEVVVRMRVGGNSNGNIKNIVNGNKDILRSFDKNNIRVSKLLYLFYRLIPKIIQMLKKGKGYG